MKFSQTSRLTNSNKKCVITKRKGCSFICRQQMSLHDYLMKWVHFLFLSALAENCWKKSLLCIVTFGFTLFILIKTDIIDIIIKMNCWNIFLSAEPKLKERKKPRLNPSQRRINVIPASTFWRNTVSSIKWLLTRQLGWLHNAQTLTQTTASTWITSIDRHRCIKGVPSFHQVRVW